MKTIITLLLIAAAVLITCAVKAQTNEPDLTSLVSNSVAAFDNLQAAQSNLNAIIHQKSQGVTEVVYSNGVTWTNTVQTPVPFTQNIGAYTKAIGGVLAAAVLFLSQLGTCARILRKALPDSWQAGNFGLFLKHSAGEINPIKGETPPKP